MSYFKLCITLQDEEGQVIDVLPFTSSTALEEKLHQIHEEHVVTKEHWLLNTVVTIKQPPHENPLLKELGPEAFEEPIEEVFPEEEEVIDATPCADLEEEQEDEEQDEEDVENNNETW